MPRHRRRRRREEALRQQRERIRTSSQSSVEIHVTEATGSLAITTSTSSASRSAGFGNVPTSTQPLLFRPTADFSQILKRINGHGCLTHQGELYTLKQLCYYLKEYIKIHQLYDEEDPRVVYCQQDPLGKAFGVEKFTIHDALALVTKNTIPVDLCYPRRPSPFKEGTISPSKDGTISPRPGPSGLQSTPTRLLHFESQHFQPSGSALGHVLGNKLANMGQMSRPRTPSCTVTSLLPSTTDPSLMQASISTPPKLQPPRQSMEVSDGEAVTQAPLPTPKALFLRDDGIKPGTCRADGEKSDRKWRRKRKHPGDQRSSECSNDSTLAPPRKRESSFSIIYSDGEGNRGGSQFMIGLELRDSDEESIYSIQSKETMIVKSSSDDYWFLDEEDDDDDDDRGGEFSLHMGGSGSLSVEIRGSAAGDNSGYMEEYEVDSVSSHWGTDSNVGSESPHEEFYVTIQSEDGGEGFWADSESSDAEPESEDQDLTDADKWRCDACDSVNRALLRYCEKCWRLRADWLPENAQDKAEPIPGMLSQPQSPRKRRKTLWQRNQNTRQRPQERASDDHAPQLTDTFVLRDLNNVPSSRGNRNASCTQSSGPSTTISRADTMLLTQKDRTSPLSTQSFPGILPSQIDTGLSRSQMSTEDSGVGSSFALSSQGSTCSPMDIPVYPTRLLDPPSQPFTYSSPNQLPTVDHKDLLKDASPIPTPINSPMRSAANILPSSPKKTGLSIVDDVCMICMSKPKEASIIHGKTGHQVCCYVCAKQLRRRGKPCPVCRRPIQKVIKNFIV